ENCCRTPVRHRLELVKAPAKKIPDKSGQRKINQSQHTQVLADSPPELVFDVPDTGANRKRMIFFVKRVASSFGDMKPARLVRHVVTRLEFDRSKEITTPRFR